MKHLGTHTKIEGLDFSNFGKQYFLNNIYSLGRETAGNSRGVNNLPLQIRQSGWGQFVSLPLRPREKYGKCRRATATSSDMITRANHPTPVNQNRFLYSTCICTDVYVYRTLKSISAGPISRNHATQEDLDRAGKSHRREQERLCCRSLMTVGVGLR